MTDTFASATGGDDPLMVVTVHHRDTIAIVSARGEIDLVTAPHLRTAVHTALTDDPGALILDLTEVTFLASAGIAAVLDAYDTAGPDRLFAVAARGAATARPLGLLGLTELLRVHSDLDAAVLDLDAEQHRR